MTAFLGEVIGTALLITLGNGVVANVVLKKNLWEWWRMDRDHVWLGHGRFHWSDGFGTLQWGTFKSCCNHCTGDGGKIQLE